MMATPTITATQPPGMVLMAGDKRLLRRNTHQALAQGVSISPAALYRLMTWLSPAYPVGAYSFSSGIEWAVEAGDIVNASTLQGWLHAMLTRGSGVNDAIIFALAYDAAANDNGPEIATIAELAAAFVSSRERHLETTAQGRSFIEVTRNAWPCTALDRLREVWGGHVCYPVAVATACAGHGIARAPSVQAFVGALTANWISAGTRLIPLGQTDSQRVTHALEPAIAETATRAMSATIDDLGSSTFRVDLSSILHETQYTRLFRS